MNVRRSGIVLSREVFATDNPRVSNPLRASLTLMLGAGISRTLAIDFVPRVVLGNQILERTFADAGVKQRTVSNTAMVFLGVRFRFDDVFEGGLARAPYATSGGREKPSATSPASPPSRTDPAPAAASPSR